MMSAQETSKNHSSTNGDKKIAAPSAPPLSNLIRPLGYTSMECGYCKGSRASMVQKQPSDCSKSYGLLVENLTPEVYEAFLYRGWRRSGIHLYKPTNESSCCPTLTIRCPVDQFRPTKSQSKLLRKFQHLLEGPKTTTTATSQPKFGRETQSKKEKKSSSMQPVSMADMESFLRSHHSHKVLIQQLEDTTRQALKLETTGVDFPKIKLQYQVRPAKGNSISKHQILLACSACAQIAGKYKLDRTVLLNAVVKSLQENLATNAAILSIQGHAQSGQILVVLQLSESEWQQATTPNLGTSNSRMSIDYPLSAEGTQDKLAEWYRKETGKVFIRHSGKAASLFRIETLPAHQSALNPQVHKLYARYQHAVHQDPDPFQTPTVGAEKLEPGDDGRFSLKEAIQDCDFGNPPSYWSQQIPDMLETYLKPYPPTIQKSVLANFESFFQFLVESPFRDEGTTLHQQYWLGDILVAVGVVDFLPFGLSSVYLYYHPGFSHSLVALGKLAILKEIECTQAWNKPFYYLGYYIESCPKMRYKADYHPSQLLCPIHYEWVDCAQAIPKLQQTPRNYCALVDKTTQNGVKDDDDVEAIDDSVLSQIPMDIGAGMWVTMNMLQENGKEVVRPILHDFLTQAGTQLARQCLVKLA